MLQKLIIRNYAIIDNLIIEPDAQLNIVTGETGAGKSIILGALSLILGDRADTSVLINKEEKCVVEAHFDVQQHRAFTEALKEEDLDNETQCIIRREISANGKSRAFVNDTPVNLNVLNKLTSLLVDLHQQFDQLALRDDQFQMDVVDAIAQNSGIKTEYQQLFREYKKITATLTEQVGRQAQFQKDADYKQFQLDELVQVGFKENEIEEAEQQLKAMAHSERIQQVLQASVSLLKEGETPMTNELKRLGQQLQGITEVLPAVQPLLERMNSAYAELKDVADELEGLEEKINLDPELMLQIQERMDIGYKLYKKHGVTTTAELLQIQQQLDTELKATLDLHEHILQLQKQQAEILQKLQKTGAQLSATRSKTAAPLAKKINELLALVGMPNARFDIQLNPSKEPELSGMDNVEYVLDANKSGQSLPIYKAASGGEMSRIMLSIKSLTAKAMQMPTLIFDEVDTGISGEAARQVGKLLRELAEYHQVICITHQPQVAAKGTRHFYVYKGAGSDQRIKTQVRVLKPEERVHAIAQMIGGEVPSEAALNNAKELVEL
jgi:DNA repair protein RecN (Recombination protein N)